MRVSLIAAVAENGVIGRNNDLPWRLPADLRRFRRLTLGHPVLLGRRNYESIGRPLPGRTNIVLTRRAGYAAPGCTVVHSLDEALAAAAGADEVFVAGGAEIYAQALERAQRFYLTRVHAEVPGDTRFPEVDWSRWRETARERHEPDAEHAYAYSFITLERSGVTT
jgi:dihydrofolate reductase